MNCNVCGKEILIGEAFFDEGCYLCVEDDVEPEDHRVLIRFGEQVEKFKFDCINDTWAFYPIEN